MRGMFVCIVLCFACSVYAQTAGSALRFIDIDEVVDGNSLATMEVNNITIEAWIKWAGSSGENQIIVYNGTTGSDGYGILLDYSSSNHISLQLGHPDNTFNTSITPSVGSWTHVAAERNSGNWTLYVNGNGTALTSMAPTQPSGQLNVGNNESEWWGFQGTIDEVRISTIARYKGNFTPSNVPFTSDGSTVTLYHFDEASGQTTADASSHSNNGVLGTTTSEDANDPHWVVSDAPLPVLVYTFKAVRDENTIELSWKTSPLTETETFVVQRAFDNNWENIATLVIEPGLKNSFTYADDRARFPDRVNKVRYRLRYFNPEGQTDYSAVQVVDLSVPEAIHLAQNYPNPFNPGTRIVYEIDEPADVRLEIFNYLGQQLQILVDEHQSAGQYSVGFNGAGLPGGIYFYRLQAGSRYTDIKKMVLLK